MNVFFQTLTFPCNIYSSDIILMLIFLDVLLVAVILIVNDPLLLVYDSFVNRTSTALADR